jgi:hypothetical protein
MLQRLGKPLAFSRRNLYYCLEMGLNAKRTCNATNRRGKPCQARAVTPDGKCAMHGGLTDPRELGRRGGQVRPNTKLREAADDDLREKARAVLLEQLEGEDERRRFEAAKSLFSYRAAQPPTERDLGGNDGGISAASGRKVVDLADILEFCVEEVYAVFEGARMQDVVLRAAERVHELQTRGVSV